MAGSLRVTGGRLVRRRFSVPEEADRGLVRPTSDRVREALFSSLGSALETFTGLEVLDAWAGSGALGIEALSRGAARVTFVESSRRVASTLTRNLKELGLEREGEVVIADVARALDRLGEERFDLILADPPYAQPLEPVLPSLVRALKPDGILVMERDKRASDPAPPALSLVRDKVYGQTRVTMWQRDEAREVP